MDKERFKYLPEDYEEYGNITQEEFEWLMRVVVVAKAYRDAEDDHENKYGRSDYSERRCEKLAHELDMILSS